MDEAHDGLGGEAGLSDDEEGTIDTADVDEAKQTTNQDTNKVAHA